MKFVYFMMLHRIPIIFLFCFCLLTGHSIAQPNISRVDSVARVSASVSILHKPDLNEQTATGHGLGDITARSVTGFAQSTMAFSNWGQSLRGRDFLVLIDGIPQSTPLRTSYRDLLTIDPEVLERVEVLRGANAVYGIGASGGLVNYVTIDPPTKHFHSTTSVGTNFSPLAPGNSLGYRFSQTVGGTRNNFGYVFSGSYERFGLFKDADADIIPVNPQGRGGLPQADRFNLFGKVRYKPATDQQVELMYNLFSHMQDTDYVTVSGVYPDEKATAEKGFVQGDPQGTRANHNLRLGYEWLNAIGKTSANAVLYSQDFQTIYAYYNGYRNGGQSDLRSRKYGFRLNLKSPFSVGRHIEGKLVYGADLLKDQTRQQLLDGRVLTPEMTMNNAAAFARLSADLNNTWLVNAGLRLETVHTLVPDYTTIEQFDPVERTFFGGVTVEGGSLTYNALNYDLGLAYTRSDKFSPFARISRGFSAADLGLALIGTTDPATIQRIIPKPVFVNNYELGVKSSSEWFRGSVVGFISTSKLRATYSRTDNGSWIVRRVPEMIYGIEAEVRFKYGDRMKYGATFTISEGRADNNDNGSFSEETDGYLANSRIAPPKATAHVQYIIRPGFDVGIHMLHSMDRNRFEPGSNERFAPYKNNIDSYTVLDLILSYDLSFGSFTVGISNLLNADYYPSVSQWAGYVSATNYAKAPGLHLNTTLKINL